MARGQNLLGKVFNKPLLITSEDLQPIADYLSNPERVTAIKFEQESLVVPKLEDFDSENQYKNKMLEYLDINPETMVGVLSVDGTLVNREGNINAQCVELTSYQGLKKKFEMQVSQGMKSCVLMISSGGGEAFGAWSTASYVKKIAKENNIKLTAYVNGSACSAAYVWAVVADEIISHPMGSSGSIGVLVQLYNDSKMLESMGVQRSFVYAGGNKIPFDEKGAFTDKFIDDLQKSVNNTYEKFVNHVVANRNLTKEEVLATNASVFDAEDAIRLGLVDKIMELEDFEIAYGLKTKATGNNTVLLDSSPVNNTQSLQSEENMSKEKLDTPAVEELQANADLPIQLSTALEQNKELTTQLAQVQESLTALEGEKSTLSSQLQELTEKYEQLEQEKVQQEAQAKMQKRQAMLEEALGKDNEKLQDILTSTEALSDDAFDIVAQGFGASVEKQQASLEEKGGEGKHTETQLSFADKVQAQMKKLK